MFRSFAIILLLIAFFSQTFTGSAIRFGYYVNRAAYAKDCINKSRPMLRCKGKCQMIMKMKEAEKKEEENSKRNYEVKDQVLSSRSFYSISQPHIEIIFIRQYFTADDKMVCSFPRSVFHPPAA